MGRRGRSGGARISYRFTRACRAATSMLRRLAGARPVDPAIAALRAEYWKVAGYQKPGGAIAMSHDEARAAGVGDSEIGALYLGHRGRHVDKWAHYLGAYEEQLGPFRRGFPNRDGSLRPLRILEIGVYKGGSLQLWRRYFGAQASVWGIDADPACSAIDDPDLEIRIGSQQDRRFLEGVVDEMGGVDVVIDDGSHQADHQRASFEVLFPLLSEGGMRSRISIPRIGGATGAGTAGPAPSSSSRRASSMTCTSGTTTSPSSRSSRRHPQRRG